MIFKKFFEYFESFRMIFFLKYWGVCLPNIRMIQHYEIFNLNLNVFCLLGHVDFFFKQLFYCINSLHDLIGYLDLLDLFFSLIMHVQFVNSLLHLLLIMEAWI